MNILGTQYTINTKSFEVYIAGCSGKPHCTGCHNPESWGFDQGIQYKELKESIKEKVFTFEEIINNIMIFGGEPLDQSFEELVDFLEFLKTLNKDIWIFTRYELDSIPNSIKKFCDYIKCGRYEESLKSHNHIEHGITLASSNQHIYKKDIDY